MNTTAKANRIHLAIFGRTNVGKSSFLNMLCNQHVSITSEISGTTTDVVEKAMELLPLGPVLFLDTAGIDDVSSLAEKRIEKTEKVYTKTDVLILVLEANNWTEYEEQVYIKAKEKALPIIAVINKSDIAKATEDFKKTLREKNINFFETSSLDFSNREAALNLLKDAILKTVPEDYFKDLPLLSDLIGSGDIVILVVPIDLEAPKGRLIMPQVQSIRDVLDSEALCLVVKEKELPYALETLNKKPKLVVCDSQVVLKVAADTPKDIKLTTFSTLFSRFKGDFREMVKGTQAIDKLKQGDRVLIAESCTHHAIGDDIGKVKIPRWLKQYIGFDIAIDHCAGINFPDDVSKYSLIIHCGSCMLNRKQMLWRIEQAKKANVPITNYGLAISKLQGVFDRIVQPFF